MPSSRDTARQGCRGSSLGVFPQRRSGGGAVIAVGRGAVVLRLAAAAFGRLAGGDTSFASEPSLFPPLGVEGVEIVTAVAHDPALTFTLVLALAPTAAGASVTTSAIVPRFLRLFSRWNGEGGERKLEEELAQAVVGDSGDQGADRIGGGGGNDRFLPC